MRHTDHELLLLTQAKDEQAFRCLYYRYFEQLYRKAFRRIPDTEAVEEIVQDVFFSLWQQAAQLHSNSNIAGWLYGVLRNKVLYKLRLERNKKEHLLRLEQHIRKESFPHEDTFIEAKQVREHIYRLVDELPRQCKQAFLLSRDEQLSYNEIAAKMNISVKTVEKHISKALRILKKELNDYDIAVVLLSIPYSMALL